MRDHIGALDAAWLHLDTPENPMVITAVLLFGGKLPWVALRTRIETRMVDPWPAFRRRIPEPGARRPRWEDDPGFDLDDHLVRMRLPPGTSLEALAGELGSQPLDVTRSAPWRLVLVEDVGEGCALIARFHHCLADGMALLRVLLSVTDEGDPTPPAPPRTGGLAKVLDDVSFDPAVLARALELSAEAAIELERLLLLPADPATPLKGPLSTRKRCGWTEPLSLDRIKAIGKAHGATVNDVLLASLAGAVRAELGPEHEVPAIRAFVPVDMRRGWPVPADLGNRFTMVLPSLPVGFADPRDRLRAVQLEMHRLRQSHEPVLVQGLLRLVGHTPALVQRLVGEIMSRKATMVVTNVPGPRERQHLLGVPLEHLLVWVPQAGGLGVGVSLVSYAGLVRIGVAADHLRLEDPGRLARRVADEIGVLERA